MTIDLTKAKAGWKVKFRCGGEAVVKKINLIGNIFYPISIIFTDISGSSIEYSKSGSFFNIEHHPFDIIELIEPEFYWKDVKWGMAFKYAFNKATYYYIGKHPAYDVCAVFSHNNSNARWFHGGLPKKSMTRSPEHDICKEGD